MLEHVASEDARTLQSNKVCVACLIWKLNPSVPDVFSCVYSESLLCCSWREKKKKVIVVCLHNSCMQARAALMILKDLMKKLNFHGRLLCHGYVLCW